jgi:hypothetical protein
MGPDPGCIANAGGYAVWPLSDKQKHWLIYLERIAATVPNVQLKLPAGKYTYAWYDVRTGVLLTRGVLEKQILQVPATAYRLCLKVERQP